MEKIKSASCKKKKVDKAQVVKVDRTNTDGHAINGFKPDRISELETQIENYDWSLRIK